MKKIMLLIALLAQSLMAQELHEYMVKEASSYIPDSILGKSFEIVDIKIIVIDDIVSDPFFAVSPPALGRIEALNFIIARYGDQDFVFLAGEEVWDMEIGDELVIFASFVGIENISHAGTFDADSIEDAEHLYNALINGEE